MLFLTKDTTKYAKIIFNTVRIFYPELSWKDFLKTDNINQGTILDLKDDNQKKVLFIIQDKQTTKSRAIIKNESFNHNLRLLVFNVLKKDNPNIPTPWGLLTGIRPVKLIHKFLDKGMSFFEIEKKLKNEYCLTQGKINKAIEVAARQTPFLKNEKKSISIYISIPFCPSKCIYCSFPSLPISKYTEESKEYLELLLFEIKEIGFFLKINNFKIQNIYIGGGTPSTLSLEQLRSLFKTIESSLDTSNVVDYTLEAGRPDTLNEDKLLLIKEYKIKRISLNPQSMNSKTLERVNRQHSPDEFIETYYMARNMGFSNINMDIIVGLPGENTNDVLYTLQKTIDLDPENITVHYLAIKRASNLDFSEYKQLQEREFLNINTVIEEKLQNKYYPYYLYRQKQIVVNGENTGYTKKGYESNYNIQMITEKQTIIGLGLGSTSKIINQAQITNLKNPNNFFLYKENLNNLISEKKNKLLNK